MNSVNSILELLSINPPGWGGVLLTGALATLLISMGAYFLGMVLGLFGAFGKLSGFRSIEWLLQLYTTVVRAVPELILIIALYYAGTDGLNRVLALVDLGPLEVNGLLAAVIVLGFVQGAYMTEVLRGAILAIPVGQLEAAKAFGMRPALRFRRVILPALIPNALPGFANLWMGVVKDSALIAVVGYQELALAARVAASNTKQYMVFFLAAAAIYLTITLISNQIFTALEAYYRRGQRELA
ncbi:ABC transporter permease subunit [Mesorhizobium sp. YC-39]|uniref:ABC transporter permease n=1 Tax=unclassified Mesorhizobium TaxID=325217 RepID=UPI0021E7B576|nr:MULTISPECIES: ABC transporter permease subunit [unclassified Mesorhizobium]MCV3211019.1 ABC transporter permease subunit [Mesorhizobium sp. YC-2]MCV3232744.1 ABC transporter permease subunit [Mesorhizobium sp. YC-39]